MLKPASSEVVTIQPTNSPLISTESASQVKSLLSALGVTPAEIDGWSYGDVTHALIPISKSTP